MNSEYMDIDFDKEIYGDEKLYEDENSLRNTLFSNIILKQDNDTPMETWNESADFDADDLLKYLGSDPTTEAFPVGVEVKRNDIMPLQKCEVDDVFNNFNDVSFDSILTDGTLKNRFESPSSDSGFSSDNNCEFQLSTNIEESAGTLSPDTMDAVSDVSSSSDLGSLGSVDSSPSGSNEQEPSMMYEYPSSPPEESSEKLYFIPASNQNIISTHHKIIPPKIKVELPSNKVNIRSISLKSFKQHKSTTNDNVMLTGQNSRLLNNGHNIIVSQASLNGSQILRKGTTYLKTTSNGKSILFPVNLKNNQLRTIKVINSVNNLSADKKNVRTLTVRQMPNVSVNQNRAVIRDPKAQNVKPFLKVSPNTLVNQEASAPRFVAPSIIIKEELYEEESAQNGQELVLNDEEKKLLKKEQINLPTQYPLSKQQERDLKRIRRKIRNKISAQDSRKRKKEYVDGLEDRVKSCNDENQKLNKRIRHLESQNESLSSQLKRLQQFVGGRNHPHTSTAVMMLALSFALIVIPTLRPQDAREGELAASSHVPSPGQTRNLLEAGITGVNTNTEEVNLSEIPEFHPLTDHDYAPQSKRSRLDEYSPMTTNFPLPDNVGEAEGEPPDVNFSAISTFFGSLLNSLGKNWTENSREEPSHWNSKVARERTKSLVVNLNSRGKFIDDIELE